MGELRRSWKMDANKVMYYATGGFMKGYRTYVLAGAGAVTVIAQWAVGDMSFNSAADHLWQLITSAGLATLRAAGPTIGGST
jgi:hypothetical protein